MSKNLKTNYLNFRICELRRLNLSENCPQQRYFASGFPKTLCLGLNDLTEKKLINALTVTDLKLRNRKIFVNKKESSKNHAKIMIFTSFTKSRI